MTTAPQPPPVLDDLSEAESFLVLSAFKGEPADLRRHTIRGSVVRDLLLEARPGWVVPTAGLRIQKAVIDGGLDLEGCTLTKPFLLWHSRLQGGGDRGTLLIRDTKLKRLGIHSCTISGNIIADRVQVESGVFLGGGLVRGHLQIRGADINGALAIEGTEIGNVKSAILAAGLRLSGPLILKRAKIKGEVSFPRAHLVSGIYGEDSNITCEGTAMNGESARLSGDLLLDRANLTGALRLPNARIAGRLSAGNLVVAASPSAIDVSNIAVENGVSLSNARIAGSLTLHGASINKTFRADGMEVWGKDLAIDADGMTVNGSWNLNRAKIYGRIDCPRAHIAGQLALDDARLQTAGVALRADNTRLQGGCTMTRARVEGSLCLPSAIVQNQFQLTGTTIKVPSGAALIASGAEFKRDVVLNDGFETDGAIVLDQTVIEGVCDLKGSKLVSSTLSHPQTAEDKEASPATAKSDPASATVDRYDDVALSLVEASVESLEMPLTAADRPHGIVDFSRAHAGSYLDFAAAWPPNPGFRGWSQGREVDHLVLDGFTYDHLTNPSGAVYGAKAPPRVEDRVSERRIAWLEGQSLPDIRDHFKPQAWVQLARRLSQQGYHDDARAITISRRRRQARARTTTIGQRLQAGILDTFALYGYNPWRTVVWMAAMIILFTGLWGWAANQCSDYGCFDEKVFAVTNRDGYTPSSVASNYPPFNALGYSFDVFVPFIPFGYEDHWRPNIAWQPLAKIPLPDIGELTGQPAASQQPVWTITAGGLLYVAMVFEMLIGLVLTSLAVTGFTGLLRTED